MAVDCVDVTALAGAVVNADVPLVVCVSADVGVRERVVRQLEDCGAVLICADLAELQAMLFPSAGNHGVGLAAGALAGLVGAGPVADLAGGHAGPATDVVSLGDLVVDAAGHMVTWRGQPLPLTRLERELLGCLASAPVGVWTYQRLFDAVWGKAYLGDTSILHSAVKRLRGKLRAVGDGLGVETVRGVGYRLALLG